MAAKRPPKRRRLSPSEDESSAKPVSSTASVADFYSRAAEWDLEQDYERRPRKSDKKDKEKSRLPIKTADGSLQHIEAPHPEESESDSFLNTDSEEEEDGDREREQQVVAEEDRPKIPLKVQIIEAKEELARIAMLINEDPEEHIGSFKRLAEMVDGNTHPTIKKLALATQLAVFRDVIPGYRIRPLTDNDSSTKLTKDVRKLRDYEQSLLSSYRHYVQQLTLYAKGSGQQKDNEASSIRTVAINCASSLLLAVPHFNFRTELLKILVNRLSKRRVDSDFVKCRETIEEIFGQDTDGMVSLEAVGLLSKMMKAKDFMVHGSVLDTFLHLRLVSEFSSKGSRDRIDRNGDENTMNGKKQKTKREFRTKKERKLEKERKAVEKDMKEADAVVTHEARDKNQAETLKLVFGTYFRILKIPGSKLMGAVLEGLAKYAHLINQDFFGDLLEALKELISKLEVGESDENPAADDEREEDLVSQSRNTSREALLCTITAFALLEGQDASKAASSLHLDLQFFVTHLYRSLYPLSLNPEIEFNPDTSLRLPDPHARSSNLRETTEAQKRRAKVNFQTPMVLLLRCLQFTLLSRARGQIPPIRLAGFTKRLMTTALQLPEKSSQATLSLLSRIVKQHGRKIAPLWHTEERKGDGVFNPIASNAEESNVFAGTIWEGELLRLHYCPQVREAALDIDKMISSVK